ncbi:MAG: transposase domain-containing protein [Phycisphaeraceae bacterium]
MNEGRFYPPKVLAGLPDMPGSERGVNGWGEKGKIGRRKRAKGKGWEYDFSTLPLRTQAALLATEDEPLTPAPTNSATREYDPEGLWGWAMTRPLGLRAEGARRAKLLDQVVVLMSLGQGFREAARAVAREHDDVTMGSLRNWYYGPDGRPDKGARNYARNDWAAALVPRWTGRSVTAEISVEAWDAFKADYLRNEQPTAESCYRRLQRLAAKHGWTVPSLKTVMRRLEREVGVVAITLAREGVEAMMRRYPAQERDRSIFHALEAVNADGHKLDVFVQFPDDLVTRPMVTVWQDLFSGKILSWRVSQTESSDSYRLSFADLLRQYGAPKHCWFDNGRGIASKALTGGTPNRFRFKVRPCDPVGLITQVVGGENIHWTTPYHGQAKPIERAFRDWCDNIAKDPRFAGAYTGNNPMAKPENYRSRAVDFATLLTVLAEGIAEHNSRSGRRTQVCAGRSFDEVFNESYAANVHRIAQPTERQLRQFLLAGESITVNKIDGSIRLLGNRYWCEALARLAGTPKERRKVVVYFDPDHLHDGIYVHEMNGVEIGHAACVSRTGFNDTTASREHARGKAQYRRATKEQLDAQRRMSAAQLGELLDDAKPEPTEPPTPHEQKVTHGVFKRVRRVAGSDVVESEEEYSEASADERYGFNDTVLQLASAKRRERL